MEKDNLDSELDIDIDIDESLEYVGSVELDLGFNLSSDSIDFDSIPIVIEEESDTDAGLILEDEFQNSDYDEFTKWVRETVISTNMRIRSKYMKSKTDRSLTEDVVSKMSANMEKTSVDVVVNEIRSEQPPEIYERNISKYLKKEVLNASDRFNLEVNQAVVDYYRYKEQFGSDDVSEKLKHMHAYSENLVSQVKQCLASGHSFSDTYNFYDTINLQEQTFTCSCGATGEFMQTPIVYNKEYDNIKAPISYCTSCKKIVVLPIETLQGIRAKVDAYTFKDTLELSYRFIEDRVTLIQETYSLNNKKLESIDSTLNLDKIIVAYNEHLQTLKVDTELRKDISAKEAFTNYKLMLQVLGILTGNTVPSETMLFSYLYEDLPEDLKESYKEIVEIRKMADTIAEISKRITILEEKEPSEDISKRILNLKEKRAAIHLSGSLSAKELSIFKELEPRKDFKKIKGAVSIAFSSVEERSIIYANSSTLLLVTLLKEYLSSERIDNNIQRNKSSVKYNYSVFNKYLPTRICKQALSRLKQYYTGIIRVSFVDTLKDLERDTPEDSAYIYKVLGLEATHSKNDPVLSILINKLGLDIFLYFYSLAVTIVEDHQHLSEEYLTTFFGVSMDKLKGYVSDYLDVITMTSLTTDDADILRNKYIDEVNYIMSRVYSFDINYDDLIDATLYNNLEDIKLIIDGVFLESSLEERKYLRRLKI